MKKQVLKRLSWLAFASAIVCRTRAFLIGRLSNIFLYNSSWANGASAISHMGTPASGPMPMAALSAPPVYKCGIQTKEL